MCVCVYIYSDSAECNGSSSSRPLLRPSLIGTPSSSSPSSHSILKPSTLLSGGTGGGSSTGMTTNSNPFLRAVDVLDDDDAPSVDGRRNPPSSGKSSVLLPSRLNHVSAASGSPLSAAGAAGETDGEAGGSSSAVSTVPTPSVPALQPSSLLSGGSGSSGNLFSMAVAGSGANGPAPAPVSTNFVFGQKLYERVAVFPGEMEIVTSINREVTSFFLLQNANHTGSEPVANGTSSAGDNLFTVAAKVSCPFPLAPSDLFVTRLSLS